MKQQHFPRYISASFILAVVLALSLSAQAQTATINVTANQQTIDGFGFSTAWTPTMTAAQGNVLFGTGSGQLGFSLLRVRLDPNESWGNEPSNAATAHSHGAKVLGSSWTPPASMKTNNSVICGDLKTSSYAAYATHLNHAVTAIGLDYVSYQNEPDWCPNPGYESSNPTPTEILNLDDQQRAGRRKANCHAGVPGFQRLLQRPNPEQLYSCQPRNLHRRTLLRQRKLRPPKRAEPRQARLGNRTLHQRHRHRHCHDSRERNQRRHEQPIQRLFLVVDHAQRPRLFH